MKHNIAIMDIGSSKVTVMICNRGTNQSINILGAGVSNCFGYSGGEWLDKESVKVAIVRAVSDAINSARTCPDRIYVGVPNDFSDCEVKKLSISLNKRRQINEADVEVLQDSGSIDRAESSQIINIQPIYYTLDDDRMCMSPIGMVSSRLAGSISYITVYKEFTDVVDEALANTQIPDREYVSASLAEILYLFDERRRDDIGVMLLDVGAYDTAFTIARGDGICSQFFFKWGGEKITDSLASTLSISNEEAARLKRKAVLSLDPYYEPQKQQRRDDEDDFPQNSMPNITRTTYEVDYDNERNVYGVEQVNTIIQIEIDKLSRLIERALKQSAYKPSDSAKIYVTGGGLINIRGATQFLSERLNRDVEDVRPPIPTLERPQLSSALGLADMVLSCTVESYGVFEKIGRWFANKKRKRSN